MQALLVIFLFFSIVVIVPWLVSGPMRGRPSAFNSRRERHLWLWALAVILAIFATLGPAGELVAVLREHNLLRLSFASVLVLTGIAVFRHWKKKRPGPA